MAYAKNKNTVYIQLRTKKNELESVELIKDHPDGWVQTDAGYVWKKESIPMRKHYTTSYFDYWQIEVLLGDPSMRYGFIVHTEKESKLFIERGLFDREDPFIENDINSYFAFPYIHEIDIFSPPTWVEKTIWYQIFPDRFYKANAESDSAHLQNWKDPKELGQYAFLGGNITGVTQKLDYLEELGVNGLYLTPIFEAPTVHKYDTSDYFKIDAAFGTKQDLKELVNLAHEKGMHLILDGVFNHCGVEFAPFQDVMLKGAESKYRDWFYIHQFPIIDASGKLIPTHYRHFVPTMPKLNTQNREVQDYLIEVAVYWMKEADIDGWRLDVANEIDHHFWRKFREAVKNVKKEAYIVGEIWHNAQPWLDGSQFDGVMNYPLTKPILEWMAAERIDTATFCDSFIESVVQYSSNQHAGMFNLLDSHDTDRIVHYAKHDLLRVNACYALLFILPGSLSLYYGSENYLEGGEDPENRKPMHFDSIKLKESILPQLIHARRENQPLFNQSTFAFIQCERDSVIIQKEFQNKRVYLFVSNKKDTTIGVPLKLQGTKMKNLLTGAIETMAETIKCTDTLFQLYLQARDVSD